MPANFPEVWLQRVRENLTTADRAPWLDGVSEIDSEVVVSGEGTATEKNTIHIPTTQFSPDVLINNTAYPIALQAYDDAEVTINLDKYQTKVTTLSDDQIMGASYDRIDPATKGHVKSISSSKFKKAIHAIAPSADSVDTPVIVATGADVNGRPTLTYDDLVTAKDKLDKSGGECPAEDRVLVLCNTHWNDLLRDRNRYGDKLVNYTTGDVAPIIAGFKIFQYVGMPLFTSAGAKKAYGAIKEAGDVDVSVFFQEDVIAKKTGDTKQYYSPAANDPETQTNKLNYRHYFIATPMQVKHVGAIR